MTPLGRGENSHAYEEGTVLRRSSNRVWVDTGKEVLSCALRGKMRRAVPCVVGDRVKVLATEPGFGALEKILPRRSVLERGGITGDRGSRITAANIDQVGVIISADSPPPRWPLVDRILAEAESQGLGYFVVVNKIDLVPPASSSRGELDEAMEVYRAVGIDVLALSALSHDGLEGLRESIRDSITVFSGHSGVGKTSLLNALVPGVDFRTRAVNAMTGKGRHTTTAVILIKLPGGGFLMDTPGFREFALQGISPAELGRCFTEFQEVLGGCRFKDCLHRTEPHCAVLAAVETGNISKLRYNNYLQILDSLLEKGEKKTPRRSARKRSSGAS